jgi:hypothetical protein
VGSGFLCVGCIEKRLGRELTQAGLEIHASRKPHDFVDHVILQAPGVAAATLSGAQGVVSMPQSWHISLMAMCTAST